VRQNIRGGLTHCARVLVEGVILVEKDVLVFGRCVCEMNRMAPWPHSSTREAHDEAGRDGRGGLLDWYDGGFFVVGCGMRDEG
jgi:hypothetical protein